jgi:hypothetical protein
MGQESLAQGWYLFSVSFSSSVRDRGGLLGWRMEMMQNFLIVLVVVGPRSAGGEENEDEDDHEHDSDAEFPDRARGRRPRSAGGEENEDDDHDHV